MSISENDIQLAKSGDEQAFIRLYNETIKTAYYVAKRLLTDDYAVEDILQESYVVIYEKLGSYNSGNFQGWVDTIVANRCKNYLRKKNPVLFSQMESDEDPQVDFEDDNIEFRPDEKMDYEETKRLVMNIIDELPDEQRLSVVLFYYEQMSVKEIAKVFECSENTIKSRLNYGRKSIKEEVLKLEKKGTKLYCMPLLPFLLWLFAEEAKACQVPAGFSMADKILRNQDKVVQNSDKVMQSPKSKALITAKVGAVLTTGKVAAVCVALLLGAGAIGGVILHNQSESNKIENAAVKEESKEFTPIDITLSVDEKTKINSVLNSLSEVFVYYTDESKNIPMTFEEQGNLVSDEYKLVLRLIKENPEVVKPYCSTVNDNLYSIPNDKLKKLFKDFIGKEPDQLDFIQNFKDWGDCVTLQNEIYTFDMTKYTTIKEGTIPVVTDFIATQVSEDTVTFHGILKGSISLLNSYNTDAGLQAQYSQYRLAEKTTVVEMHFCVTAKLDSSSDLYGYRFIGSHCQLEEYKDLKIAVATTKQQKAIEMIPVVKDFIGSYKPDEIVIIKDNEHSNGPYCTYVKNSGFEYAYFNLGDRPMLIVKALYDWGNGDQNNTNWQRSPLYNFYYYNRKTDSVEQLKLPDTPCSNYLDAFREIYTNQDDCIMISNMSPTGGSGAAKINISENTLTTSADWDAMFINNNKYSYTINGYGVNEQVIREKKREMTHIKWEKH